jgi:uncharacterized protein YbcC (UPF0753/DUF2309 family)
MSQPHAAPAIAMTTPLDEAIAGACARIAPTWPLDRFIAVNPLWGFIERPLPEVSGRLAALSGTRLLMPRAWYRQHWQAGRFTAAHLRAALAEVGSTRTVEQLAALLDVDAPAPARRTRMTDLVDDRRDLVHDLPWKDFVVHSISQACAAYFDEGQAQLGPAREGGLYATWRRHALVDRAPVLLMGLAEYPGLVRALPADAETLLRVALAELDVPAHQLEAYLTALLLDVNGWAAWCAYRRWTARLSGGDDDALVQLLAVRVAWEWLLVRAGGRPLAARWQLSMASWPRVDATAAESQADDWVFQRAVELAYQQTTSRALASGFGRVEPARPSVQVAFCIDVRSEPYRRALEAQGDDVQTLGFAGFFGLPAEYQPLGTSAVRPQLPGLLAPKVRVADTGVDEAVGQARARHLDAGALWRQLKASAISGFTYVEALGLLSAGELVANGLGLTRPAPHADHAGLSASERARAKPRLVAAAGGQPLDAETRVELAAGILRAMSLTHGFARLVVLLGHGSHTVNNPHAAGLDCGACGGQSGEVNARAVAALLNEPAVRFGLRARGIDVPDDTRFVAGLHGTTTDVVELFDLDELPPTHAVDLHVLSTRFEQAGDVARARRAASLGLPGVEGAALKAAVDQRTRDWAQVRPEWGLAGNAALVIAPRTRTRHLDLQGRAFLHDYRWEEDDGFRVLELLMTAPMVVAHWINLQYYASTVDNLRYGSGNKVLHNVVGGRLGVFEGNGGDLRIGLPLQSLHDGERWVHAPQRLSVFIEAPRPAIEAVLARHATVRHLVDNGWLFLFQLDAGERGVSAYRAGQWTTMEGAAS